MRSVLLRTCLAARPDGRRTAWILTGVDESRPLNDSVDRVETEEVGRDLSYFGSRNDGGMVETKVLVPRVCAWIEEASQLTGIRGNRGQVGALVPVAERTGVSQVPLHRLAAVLLADDVVDLAAEEGVILVNEAVLAKVVGALRDAATEFGADVAS